MPIELDLASIDRGAISAPAGCGKTHLICDAITKHGGPKPILVLTHTNAGVGALKTRLAKRAPDSAYRISTIDGWSLRLIAMFPAGAGLDPDILKLENPRNDYPAVAAATERLLGSGALDDVLAATYSRLIVDEYQDCSPSQHRNIGFLARVLPTVVLGDPLQAIFAFRGAVALDWTTQVEATFKRAGELTIPHRWINAGEESFGRWLLDLRAELLAGRALDLRNAHANVNWVALDGGRSDYARKLEAGRSPPPGNDGKVIILADSTDKAGQRRYASQIPGAVVAEAVDLSDLVEFARSFDLRSPKALDQLSGYVERVVTNFSADDLVNRVATINAGRERKEPSEIETLAISFKSTPTYQAAADLASAVAASGGVRVHRPAMLNGLFSMLRQCDADPAVAPLDAATAVRERSRVVGRPLAKRTVGSTLLLKGLEAEMSVVLDIDGMDARHLYVAGTRGSKRLIICSPRRMLP